MSSTKIMIIGLWHLGCINAVGFCAKGYNVVGIETDLNKLKLLQNSKLPLYEPGLQESFELYMNSNNLRISNDYSEALDSDYVIIAFDSPVNEKDEVDISPILIAACNVSVYLKENTPLIITSQVPLGTCEYVERIVKINNLNWKSGVVYTPENLKLGQAINRFLNPDMLVFGANESFVLDNVLKLYEPFDTEKITMDLKSSEMVKHALNTFLATSISFANEIGRISKLLGADAIKVGKALKFDKRIGKSALLMPGLGFSGGTLARDVKQLQKFAIEHNENTPFLDAIFAVNDRTFDDVILMLESKLGVLNGKNVGILGITYKADTSTVRRSPALKIINMLNQLGVNCKCYDPQADNKEILESGVKIERVNSINEAMVNSDALVLLTEWSEFRSFNFDDIYHIMKRPLIIDTKNYLDPNKLINFEYECFGKTFR